MTGQAKFSDQKYVEGSAQRTSDLSADRHAASGQRENHDVIAIREMAKVRGKLRSGMASVAIGLI